MKENLLKGIGLTQLEIRVYLALLELGNGGAGRIATRSGVHRRSVYDALDRMVEKGLATKILMNNKMEYQPVSPQRLLGLLKEKQADVEDILPELMLKYEMSMEKQTTLFFKGKEGIKSVFDDQIKEGKTVYIISGTSNVYTILPYFIKRYDKSRVEKKMHAKILFKEDARGLTPPLSEIKYLPKGSGGNASVNIYGNNVAIILWSAENPFAILIRHEDIAKSYMDYFNLLWKTAK